MAVISCLVVDDDPTNLMLLDDFLSSAGYRIFLASNGATALIAAARSQVDIILLDIDLPGMSGYEVCRQLKSERRTRHIPVIFMSVLDAQLIKAEADQAGGVEFIAKPLNLDELLAKVQTHLPNLSCNSHSTSRRK